MKIPFYSEWRRNKEKQERRYIMIEGMLQEILNEMKGGKK